MRRIFIFIRLILFAGISCTVNAQNPDTEPYLEAIIESIVEELAEDADASLLAEDLQEYALNPLNINTASPNQLSRLHILSDIQIARLLKYREEYGPVLSIYELNVIEGYNPELLLKMEPFVWFGSLEQESLGASDILNYGRHEVLLRSTGIVQKQAGYIEQKDGMASFGGNRLKYYARYRFRSANDFSIGITAENDPGEDFFNRSNPSGFDFYSAHLSAKVNPVINKFIIGDFIVRSGQGLVLWQGFSMGKSMYATQISKTNHGIRPYTSTDENRFFRGVATSVKIGDSMFHIFFSKKARDGNIASNDSLGRYFTSLQTSGYHRTANEIADKNTVSDFNAGILGNIQYRNIKLGAVFSYQKFDMPFLPVPQLYNLFYFRGTENYAGSVDYLYSKGKYQLFGESAISKSGGIALLHGLSAYLHDRIQLSSLFRHFNRNYHALWSSPFAENHLASNETGLYTGIRILPARYFTFSAYADIYQSRWIKYTTAAPSNGWDIFSQVDFRPSEKFQLYFRYKNEEKDQKIRIDEKNENHPEQYRKSRIHIQFAPSKSILLKTRFETVTFIGTQKERGYMIFQDVQFSPARFPLNISGRIAWFNTESYNSGIYAYENDLLYSFAIPAYYSNGYRSYLNLKYRLNQNVEVWMKLAYFIYMDDQPIGSGYNEINGNQKTELKFQLRLKI